MTDRQYEYGGCFGEHSNEDFSSEDAEFVQVNLIKGVLVVVNSFMDIHSKSYARNVNVKNSKINLI